MERGDQGRQLAFLHILQLVDEQHQRCPTLGRCGSGQVNEIDQVGFEVAIIGHPYFSKIERSLKLAIAQLERFHEPRKRAQAPLRQRHRRLAAIELQHGSPKRRDQHGGQ